MNEIGSGRSLVKLQERPARQRRSRSRSKRQHSRILQSETKKEEKTTMKKAMPRGPSLCKPKTGTMTLPSSVAVPHASAAAPDPPPSAPDCSSSGCAVSVLKAKKEEEVKEKAAGPAQRQDGATGGEPADAEEGLSTTEEGVSENEGDFNCNNEEEESRSASGSDDDSPQVQTEMHDDDDDDDVEDSVASKEEEEKEQNQKKDMAVVTSREMEESLSTSSSKLPEEKRRAIIPNPLEKKAVVVPAQSPVHPVPQGKQKNDDELCRSIADAEAKEKKVPTVVEKPTAEDKRPIAKCAMDLLNGCRPDSTTPSPQAGQSNDEPLPSAVVPSQSIVGAGKNNNNSVAPIIEDEKKEEETKRQEKEEAAMPDDENEKETKKKEEEKDYNGQVMAAGMKLLFWNAELLLHKHDEEEEQCSADGSLAQKTPRKHDDAKEKMLRENAENAITQLAGHSTPGSDHPEVQQMEHMLFVNKVVVQEIGRILKKYTNAHIKDQEKKKK